MIPLIQVLMGIVLGAPVSLPAPEIKAEAQITAPFIREQVIQEIFIGPVRDVPFYSQFNDISSPSWKKVGCGIASLAMIIEYYFPGSVSVDTLLSEGISAGAFLNNAGWIHRGLISLSNKYGLDGATYDFSGGSMDVAFGKLTSALKDGPVMASVYYTFDPKNPIPHLVVINSVSEDGVYYNDPAGKQGGGLLSINDFKMGWKKRFIMLRPKI